MGTLSPPVRSGHPGGSQPSEPGFPSLECHLPPVPKATPAYIYRLGAVASSLDTSSRGGLKPQWPPKRSEDPAGERLSLKVLISIGKVLFPLFSVCQWV